MGRPLWPFLRLTAGNSREPHTGLAAAGHWIALRTEFTVSGTNLEVNVRTWLIGAFLLAATALGGCGDDGDEGDELPDVDCSGTIPKYEDVAALDKCTTCHSSELSGDARKSAALDVNFDTKAAAEAKAEKAAEEVNEGAMPPSGSGVTLSAAEKEDLYKWALCR